MSPAHRLWLETMYSRDSSFAYECSGDDLERLLSIFGEMEPIIDAMNVLSGASIEQRAQDIGSSPDDFNVDGDDDHEIVAVSDLELAASIPWSYGV